MVLYAGAGAGRDADYHTDCRTAAFRSGAHSGDTYMGLRFSGRGPFSFSPAKWDVALFFIEPPWSKLCEVKEVHQTITVDVTGQGQVSRQPHTCQQRQVLNIDGTVVV